MMIRVIILIAIMISVPQRPFAQQLTVDNNAFMRRIEESNGDNGRTPDTYFREFIKSYEVNVTRSNEFSQDDATQIQLKKLLTEERLDKMEVRMTTELRKLSNKLMKIEESVKNLTGRMETLMRAEMHAMKEELLREMRANSNLN